MSKALGNPAMEDMDSKNESIFSAALTRLWPYGHRSDESKQRTTGEFEPGSLRALVFLVVACWAVIGFAFWAL